MKVNFIMEIIYFNDGNYDSGENEDNAHKQYNIFPQKNKKIIK